LKAYPILFLLGKEVYDDKLLEKKDRFIVNVVGRYNVGKTYILRLLANIDLGDSFTERTIGVSVSLPSPKDTNGTPMALIDTTGTRTPVLFDNKNFNTRSYQRQVSDSFIQEIAFNSADVFVLVVNQFTLDDQLYLKTLTRRLKVFASKNISSLQNLSQMFSF
jgi:predicted GTPase